MQEQLEQSRLIQAEQDLHLAALNASRAQHNTDANSPWPCDVKPNVEATPIGCADSPVSAEGAAQRLRGGVGGLYSAMNSSSPSACSVSDIHGSKAAPGSATAEGTDGVTTAHPVGTEATTTHASQSNAAPAGDRAGASASAKVCMQ